MPAVWWMVSARTWSNCGESSAQDSSAPHCARVITSGRIFARASETVATVRASAGSSPPTTALDFTPRGRPAVSAACPAVTAG